MEKAEFKIDYLNLDKSESRVVIILPLLRHFIHYSTTW